MADVPLRCACGELRGVCAGASGGSGTRIVCYCDDCQAFAAFLGRGDVLDAAGGTDIFQTAPARVRITAGHGHLAVLRLSEKGLLRWYAACCRTPIANTLAAWLPFAGLVQPILDHGADGGARDAALGAPIARIHARYARGAAPDGAEPRVPLRLAPRLVRALVGWKLGGLGRPSPFFDARTGAPVTAPRVLTAAERAALTPAPGA